MTSERMLDIINYNVIATEEESIEAYTMYFKMLGVSVCNPDGTYKTMFDIFKEASVNINK